MAEFGFNITIQDYSANVSSELPKATERALFAIGVLGVEGSVDSISNENLAVDTGRLRASISFVTQEGEKGKSGFSSTNSKGNDGLSGNAPKNSVWIGSNVEYATAVHEGTKGMKARPFLRDGIIKKRDEMQKQAELIFKGQL